MPLAHWLPPIAWMALVLGLSTDAASAEQTSRFLLPLLHWLLPGAAPEQIAAMHGLVRKAGHVTEYAILALLWFRAFRRGRGLGPRASAWLALGVGLAWAFLDEWHQSALLARTGSALDVLLDATGAVAALGVVRLGWRAALDGAATLCLWAAALGGGTFLAINAWIGVASGVLWLAVPAAVLALLARRLLRTRARSSA